MLKISEQVRDELVKYLVTRPYAEVAGGIQMLNSLEVIEETKKEK